MGSRGGGARGRAWSVFDAVRSFPSTPEALMAQIDAAIAAHEYTHATALLSASPSSSPPPTNDDDDDDAKAPAAASSVEDVSKEGASAARRGAGASGGPFDARLADDAYRAACAALASRRPDAAVRSLRVAIANCPPDKASAVAKLHSLLAIASAQLQRQQKRDLLH